jgi:hypothetical protein
MATTTSCAVAATADSVEDHNGVVWKESVNRGRLKKRAKNTFPPILSL